MNLKNATNHCHFGFVFEENSIDQGNRLIIVIGKLHFQIFFHPHESEKPAFPNSFGLKSVFEELRRFSDRLLSVDGRPNPRNSVFFPCGVDAGAARRIDGHSCGRKQLQLMQSTLQSIASEFRCQFRLDHQPLFGKGACAPLPLGEGRRPDTTERRKLSLMSVRPTK